MTILAVDPGTTVGWSMYNLEGDKLNYNQLNHTYFPALLKEIMPVDVIVYERYYISRVEQETVAAEVIGMLRWCAYYWECDLVRQEPTDIHFIGNTFRWRKRRLISRGIHAFDAFKHLLFYLYQTRGRDFAENILDGVTL